MTSFNFRLGKREPKIDSRTLQFADYLGAQPPPAPVSENWGTKVSAWGMLGNDTIGDCTTAASGHMIEAWTSDVGPEFLVPESAVITAYSAVSGYDPVTGANDNGAYCLDVLNYWRKTGIAGHKILAYAALKPGHQFHVEAGVYLFGSAYLGLEMPISAQSQVGGVWDVPAGGLTGDGTPGSWGGHAVPAVAYGPSGVTVVTWGALQHMTWAFLAAYCSEAYAVLSADFLNASKISASGFNLVALKADLHKVTG